MIKHLAIFRNNHFPPGGMFVHAMAVVDKVVGGIKHDYSHEPLAHVMELVFLQ